MSGTSIERMREDALEIVQAAIRAVEPGAAVKAACTRRGAALHVRDRVYDLDRFQRVLIVGAGKAGAPMARALEEILGDRVAGGVVCVKYGHLDATRKVEVLEGGHPIPDHNGLEAASRILATVRQAGDQDLILCVLSGGGSALTPSPSEGLTLEHKQEVTRLLLASGATIHEINSVRKHLSAFKGGHLARAAYPATLVSLILSDVIGDDLDVIASGPTVADSSTFHDCLGLFRRYGIEDRIPEPVLNHVLAGVQGRIPETPKPGDAVFVRTQNEVVACNTDAVEAAAVEARRLGYTPLILSTRVQGETREVARALSTVAMESLASGNPVAPPACILSGGETTVTIKGDGLGGRNMEFVLAAGLELDGWNHVVAVSVGTDGTDGPTDAAGALCDGTGMQAARARDLDPRQYLDRNDSYHFFDRLGGLIRTGPTNTNVMDIRFFLVARPA